MNRLNVWKVALTAGVTFCGAERGSSGGFGLIPDIVTTSDQPTTKEHSMRRRTFLGIAIAATLVTTRVTGAVPAIEVYKSPTCGCCGKWAEHLRKDGFCGERS